MKDVIDGLAVFGALNVATLFAFAVWALTVQWRDRRVNREEPRSVYAAVDVTGRNLTARPVSGATSEHHRDRAWPD